MQTQTLEKIRKELTELQDHDYFHPQDIRSKRVEVAHEQAARNKKSVPTDSDMVKALGL